VKFLLGAFGGGLAGLAATLLLFWAKGAPCPCSGFEGHCGECVFGKTATEYWQSYGAGISFAFSALGALIYGSS